MLERPAGRVHVEFEAVGVVEDQRRTLVAGEPARKADGECVVVQDRAGCEHPARAHAILGPQLARALADEGEQIIAQRRAHLP